MSTKRTPAQAFAKKKNVTTQLRNMLSNSNITVWHMRSFQCVCLRSVEMESRFCSVYNKISFLRSKSENRLIARGKVDEIILLLAYAALWGGNLCWTSLSNANFMVWKRVNSLLINWKRPVWMEHLQIHIDICSILYFSAYWSILRK